MENDSTRIELKDQSLLRRPLAIACTRGREAIVVRFKDMLARERLTEQQWRVLRVLADEGAMIGTELSERTCIHKASLSRIIPSMEAAGWLTRTQSDADARAQIVQLSRSGAEAMDRLLPEADEIYAGVIAELGEAKYAMLLELMDDLARLKRP